MILIIDCGSTRVPDIEMAVDETADFKTVHILELEQTETTAASGVIISGAPILVTEQPIEHYLERLSWIMETSLPVLGICFGHQLISLIFGGTASRMKDDRGPQTIGILKDSLLFSKLPEEIVMIEDHCETVSVPNGFILTATSDVCINEAMEHKEKPIYGVQFHPESSGNHGRVIIENFVSSCHSGNFG